MPRAVGLTDELLEKWAPIIAEINLKPGKGGVFEVTLDGELIYSKKDFKRHANPGEIAGLVEARIGAPIPRE
ncbi:MAG: SelT/SelW/SelH family protein [Candidatus Dormibacteria bacterium]